MLVTRSIDSTQLSTEPRLEWPGCWTETNHSTTNLIRLVIRLAIMG